MSKRIREKIEVIPTDTLPELIMPHIDLCSNCHAVVEGCKGILEYDSDKVKLNCGAKIVTFLGTRLSITALFSEQITVSGVINQISFEK